MKKERVRKPKDLTSRFGIGEWYGHILTELTAEQRRYYANENLKLKKDRDPQPCPFKATKSDALCTKDGGVCSLRAYQYAEHPTTTRAMGVPVAGKIGEFRATCPNRFSESLDVFSWVGQTILGDPNPRLVGEVGFLEAGATRDNEAGGDDVGRIDMVLVSNKTPKDAPMVWAALEIQAVYFSGDAMKGEFRALADTTVDWVTFPAGRRRPDYRSCGPKRLMPQLQIKVPTLRRWGRKMAVVVDQAFFDSIGIMDNVSDISNADIAWFIVRFEETPGSSQARMIRGEVRYTTLERAVEGLTGGTPVPLSVFENRISYKVTVPQLNEPNFSDLFDDVLQPEGQQ